MDKGDVSRIEKNIDALDKLFGDECWWCAHKVPKEDKRIGKVGANLLGVFHPGCLDAYAELFPDARG